MEQKAPARILVVQPDANHLRLLRNYLTGYHLVPVLDLEGALGRLYETPIDLVIVSQHVDNVTKWIAEIRAESTVPLIVTVYGTIYPTALVDALDAGADDYLNLLESDVLQAKVRSLLRRNEQSRLTVSFPPAFQDDGLSYDFATRSLTVDGRQVVLSRTEQKILAVLMQNAPSTIPTQDLMERVWGPSSHTYNIGSLRTYICYIRQKIEADPSNPQRILTVPWIGYRFAAKGASV